MIKINVHNNAIDGKIDIILSDAVESRKLHIQWCHSIVSEQKITGFKSSFIKNEFIPVTPLASESFLNIILYNLVAKLKINPDDITITNSWGEIVDSIHFLPPDFDFTSIDMSSLIQKRMTLESAIHLLEENRHLLTKELIKFCENHEILDDFLSIINLQSSNFQFNFQGETNE